MLNFHIIQIKMYYWMKKESHFNHRVLTPNLEMLPERTALSLFDQVTA